MTTSYLTRCMDLAGFTDVEAVPRRISWKMRTPYRDPLCGGFTRDSKQRRVYGEELVLVARLNWRYRR